MRSPARKYPNRESRGKRPESEPLEIGRGPLEPLEPREDLNDESLRQHLDMIEPGVGPWEGKGPRGDDVEHRIPHPFRPVDSDPLPFDAVLDRWDLTLSEENREGDEMSGDEHSTGQQGDDPGLPES